MGFAVERSLAWWRRILLGGLPHRRGSSQWIAQLVMRSVRMADGALRVDTLADGRPLLRSAVVMHASRRLRPIVVGIAEGCFRTIVGSLGRGCSGH
jgi:hypothetical protein